LTADCIFCKIAKGEIPANVVYQDDQYVVFEDIKPQAPVHLVIVPREHIATVVDAVESKPNVLAGMMKVGVSVAKMKGLEPSGYRFVMNYGKDGGQLVQHIHIHLLGGKTLRWPPG
jgi:histidine triad (HIT) family protein